MVSFPVGHIAHAVPGGGKGQQGLICGAAAGTVLPPHGAGDEAVVLAVEEEDGRVAVRQRPGGGGLLRVKAAEEAAAEAQQGIDREDRQMGGADDALQNGGRRAVAAVGHDAGDVFRQLRPRRHEDGRRAHGHAVEHDLRVRPGAADHIIDPAAAVIPLADTEREAAPAAFPVGALVDEQDIAAHPHAKRQPAAEIALRRAAVAVKQQEPRRVRGCGIAAAEQRQSVVRADRYRLIGKGEGRADHAPRLRRIRPVLVRVRQDEHFLFGRFPRAERQPEQQKRQPERQEHKARCDQQRDANVLHSRAPIHRPRMLMTPCRAKLASAHGAASSMTARQSASSRLRAAMRSHCPRETGVTPK